MIENEIENEVRDNLKETLKSENLRRKMENNSRIENDYLNCDFEPPDWENRFIDIIEQMRTIPYVLLGHFQFINVNWIDETVTEEDEIEQIEMEKVEEKQSVKHWNLVKRMMIFSKMATKKLQPQNLTNEKVPLNKSPVKLMSDLKTKRNYRQTLSEAFGQLKDAFLGKKDTEIKGSTGSKLTLKDKKSSKILKTQSVKEKSNQANELNLKNETTNELTIRKVPFKKNYERGRQQMLKKSKLESNALLNLDDIVLKRKLYKLSPIMNRDDGPFMTDFSFLLGIEFWSNFCGVDRNQLISVCSNDFWLKELKTFISGKLINSGLGPKDNQQSFRKKIGYFAQLKEFLKGADIPAKAPQRVISSEEKFKLIPYPKLFNPNTDLKKTFHYNTMQDQLNKKIKKLYLAIVRLIDGKYPLIRNVKFEEAYEDILLWVLDTYQAKTRFIALMGDQINWEII